MPRMTWRAVHGVLEVIPGAGHGDDRRPDRRLRDWLERCRRGRTCDWRRTRQGRVDRYRRRAGRLGCTWLGFKGDGEEPGLGIREIAQRREGHRDREGCQCDRLSE